MQVRFLPGPPLFCSCKSLAFEADGRFAFPLRGTLPRKLVMRGSPLFRSLLVGIILIAAAFGIHRLTASSTPPAATGSTEPTALSPDTAKEVPFFLTCSALPARVVLESGGEILELEPTEPLIAGTLPLDGEHPTLFLTVVWRDHAQVPRFAKLTLEPAGQPTRSHVFDAAGDIEDVWEPHLHP